MAAAAAQYSAVTQEIAVVEPVEAAGVDGEDDDEGTRVVIEKGQECGSSSSKTASSDSRCCCLRLSKRMRVLLTISGMLLLLAVQTLGAKYKLVWVKDDEAEDDNSGPGPETCGQDRDVLSQWFMDHGSPDLVLPPKPPLFETVETNPYDDPRNPPLEPDEITGYCGMQWATTTDKTTGLLQYTLQNFTTEQEVLDAGFEITHEGHCGACSSLQDLGVYMSQNLTDPTTICGILGLFSEDLALDCLSSLGFSDMCRSIWFYNTENTARECLKPCLLAFLLDVPNNLEDGSLNACLQCDEDKSGPNFQYFAGRTRRNSGIPSAIERPDEEIYDMEHCYFYGLDDPQTDSANSAFPTFGTILLTAVMTTLYRV